MSGYPTMDQYNDVVQHPGTAFTDASLRLAVIEKNGMGLPKALGGGFALTYTAKAHGKKYAVRCFHKESLGLERRYASIAKGLRDAGGNYFVGFEYQPKGVLVNGAHYPIVKMDWVEGDTLGSFLEVNFKNKARIESLRQQFNALELFLRKQAIAHGDIQNGNLLIGSDLKLIDYDGVYVPSLAQGQGTELGHKHFQHPKRTAADFGPEMDRFSFLVVDLSLRAIAKDPGLFSKHSNGENIVLTANDFADPGSSAAFADIQSIPDLKNDATNLAKICLSPMSQIPTLEDFIAGKNIPNTIVNIQPKTKAPPTNQQAAYIGAFDVVDANNYNAAARHVGNKVELVGKVTKVHVATTKYGKPYCFVFFGHSNLCVKLNIWSEGISKLANAPSPAWVGKWLSVQGLIDPPYKSGRYGTSISITITSNSQIRNISEPQAQQRLRQTVSGASHRRKTNQEIIDGLSPTQKPQAPQKTASIPRSKNAATLNTINTGPRKSTPSASFPSRKSTPTPKRGLPWGWIIFGLFVLFLFAQAN
ncbi:hypothetical protein [Hyphomonas oceanitis]|uniref:hypothetical protein n=1 Tax=Hyphomonas oceanitis TaxID=81033 RepID=UPI003002E266